MGQSVRATVQRTLFLTLGESGAAVGQRLAQMLNEWGSPPVVAVRHLDPEGESGEAVEAALHEVSRLGHRTALHNLGYEPGRLDQLAVWVVGPPDAPLADVARLAAGRAGVLLGLDPLTLGLVLCPPSSPPHAVGTPPRAGGTKGGVTGPCYLSALVNEAGLMLDDVPALYERVARFLALHTCTPLRDAPTWMEQASGWGDGLGYASFGLTWLAWPGAVAQARAARRMVEPLGSSLMGPPGEAPDADALLREAALAPPLLAPRITPAAAAAAVQMAADGMPPLAPWALLRHPGQAEHPPVERMKAMVGEWQAALAGCAPAWERLMQSGISDTTAQVRAWVAQALDAGGLGQARALVPALEQRLGEWAAGAEQRLEEAREDLACTEQDGQAVLAELAALLEKMPRRCLGELLPLLRNPLRWAWLWLSWRKAQGLQARYLLLQAAALDIRLVIEQMERACGIYWAAGAELQSVSQELDRLERNLGRLFSAADEEAPGWPPMPLLLGDDPDALLAQLAERYLPAPQAQTAEFLARWGPISRWWVEGLPPQAAVDEWLVEQAAPLAALSVWQVARCRYPQPDDLRAWIEELVAQASPLWRWDPATLSDDERVRMGSATVLLGPPDDGVPGDDDRPGLRVLPLSRADRLAVVTLRWGIKCETQEVET